MFFNTSLNFVAGVIHVALLETYPDTDPVTISWIGALFSSMFCLGGLLGTIVIHLSSTRTCVMLSGLLTLTGFTLSFLVTDIKYLFITYSLIAGCGQSFCCVGPLVSLSYHFQDTYSIALGIATAGSGLGAFVFPPLTQLFLDTYGLNGTFLMLGALGFQSSACGALMEPTEQELSLEPAFCCNRKNNVPEKDMSKWKDRFRFCQAVHYRLLLVNSIAFHLANSSVFLFLPDYFGHLGSTAQETAILLAVAGVTGTIARAILGMLASSIGADILFGVMFGIIGVATFFIKWMFTLGSKISYVLILGLYSGGSWSLQYVLLMETTGIKNIESSMGGLMFCGGLGYLFGPPIAEMLAIHYQDSYIIFVFSGVCFAIASISGLLIPVTAKRYYTRDVIETEIGEKDQLFMENGEEEVILDAN
ncbi:hypothetical protein SNE40_001413 [Patella caerulea]|uniref:Uncharacterized protein n=1 Tax=Patella caerulea TaxID=87958 RepID=A0AAN8KN13_PATCE